MESTGDSRRDIDHWVDETLMGIKWEADRIRQIEKKAQKTELAKVGGSLEKYDRSYLEQCVGTWVSQQDHPTLAIADAIDSLLGSELLEQEDAPEEQLDEARKGKMNVSYALQFLEILKAEGERLALQEKDATAQELLEGMIQRADRRIEEAKNWEHMKIMKVMGKSA